MIANKRLEKMLAHRNKVLCEPILRRLTVNRAYLERPYNVPLEPAELKSKQDGLMQSVKALLNYDFCRTAPKSFSGPKPRKTKVKQPPKTPTPTTTTTVREEAKAAPLKAVKKEPATPAANSTNTRIKKESEDNSVHRVIPSNRNKASSKLKSPEKSTCQASKIKQEPSVAVVKKEKDVEDGEISSDEGFESENSKKKTVAAQVLSKKRCRSKSRRSRSRSNSFERRKYSRRDSRSPQRHVVGRRNRSRSRTPLRGSNRYNSNQHQQRGRRSKSPPVHVRRSRSRSRTRQMRGDSRTERTRSRSRPRRR